MSEQTITLSSNVPPWSLLLEVAQRVSAKWILVGGLMVQIHALLTGLSPSRTTNDVDMLLDLVANRAAVGRVLADLYAIGFISQDPGWPDAPYHRLLRDSDVIDVLVADHLPAKITPHVLGRPVMAIDGGAQALSRTMSVTVVWEDLQVHVVIPDLLGALILKAAAAIADNRDADRHLKDAAFLAAFITDHATERIRLRGSDRKRLIHLAQLLDDPYHPAWLALPDDLATRGKDTLRILTQ